jgi:hypothetical protein
MERCSIVRKLQIAEGGLEDYKRLSHWHYREGRLGAFERIFAMRPVGRLAGGFGIRTAGVIVYTMPSPGCELRNAATGDMFGGLDRVTRLKLVNRNIRCIGRVIIEPRFRGLGLAAELVRETMGRMDAPIVEAMAVMGMVHPFFEKAGMRAYAGTMPRRCVQMLEALSMAGVEREELIEPSRVEEKLGKLAGAEVEFIERETRSFLQSYGKRRRMEAGAERIRFVLSKLTERPVYYIWFNPNLACRV